MSKELATILLQGTGNLHTLFRTPTCSEDSFNSRGARNVFKIVSSLASESAKAIRSSTLPTRLNSFDSDDSVAAVVAMVFSRFNNKDISWVLLQGLGVMVIILYISFATQGKHRCVCVTVN